MSTATGIIKSDGGSNLSATFYTPSSPQTFKAALSTDIEPFTGKAQVQYAGDDDLWGGSQFDGTAIVGPSTVSLSLKGGQGGPVTITGTLAGVLTQEYPATGAGVWST
jgi:hypothetical protein